ncbi:MAG TPA: hypothetical protein VGO29_06970 [Solirubrobacteraceae bacterium]|jgi:hypothetical protein|nr:hypothetical protein [Solirubrobacteraceae bacterium]
MTGLFLSAWVLFPLALLGVCTGAGLLVRRLSGGAVSGVLVLPVGFSLLVTLSTLGTSITWLAPATAALVVAIAVVGIVTECLIQRPRPRVKLARGIPYPAIAAFVAFAAIAAPVVLTGTPSWTGFDRITDTAGQMGFAQHLAEAGRSVPAGNSSFNITMQGLAGNGYPGGGQATLGVMAHVVGTDVPWCFQAYQAWAAAMGALALFALMRRVIGSQLMCCIGAAVAIQPNILYDYALVSGIKEMTTASLIPLVAAILAERLPDARSLRSGLALAPAIAASVAAFSYGVIPWFGLLLPAAFVISLLVTKGRLRTIASWAIAAIATTILAIPTVISSVKLFGDVKTAVNGVVELGLGNLTAPIPEIASVGVWISSDYRFPMFAHASASRVFDALAIALAAIGVLYALWRRNWVVAAFGVAIPIALSYWVAHGGPWIELKAYTITAPMVLAMAFVGAGALATLRLRHRKAQLPLNIAGWAGALAIAGAVLYGNALTYHDISLAPVARYEQLEGIGKRFAGVGPAFFPAFDEYSEYFLRREHGYDLNIPPGLKVRPGALVLAPGQFAFALDLNQLELSFVESFPLLVTARSPVVSRPPANFDLADQTADFQVWRRVRPASEVLTHFPLSGLPNERTSVFCEGLRKAVQSAGTGASIAYVPTSPRTVLIPTQAKHPSYWHAVTPEALRAYGQGSIEGSISVSAAGTYEVSMPGSVGRRVTVLVDGRRVGSIGYQERYPGQYLRFGRIALSAGAHSVRLTRPAGDLHPGSGDGPDTSSGILGSLTFALQRPQAGKLRLAAGKNSGRVCAAHVGYQWIEVLKPGARAPVDALSVPR